MTNWKVNVPEGVSGNWTVKKFTVTPEQASVEAIRAMFNRGRGVPAGSYTQLTRNGQIIMSDTPDEQRDHFWAIREAQKRGADVLVNGLGLGMVANAMLQDYRVGTPSNVQSITVVELSTDVITLVAPHLDPRIKVVHGDAYTWQPPKGIRYSVVWHDIWPTLSSENLEGMTKLHRKYGRRCDWQGSWGKELIKSRTHRRR